MGKKILIVDDSSVMRKMIKQTLINEHHQIAGEAKNGKDAVQMYKALKPDIVTMDITMREMDGFEAAREILRSDPDAQIVFLTNLDQDKYSEDAKQLGAKGYVNKHDPKQIVALINSL